MEISGGFHSVDVGEMEEAVGDTGGQERTVPSTEDDTFVEPSGPKS